MSYAIESARKRNPEHLREDVQELFALLGDGKIKPRIAEVMPLGEAGRTLELLEGGKVTGKIVLRP